LIEKASCPWIIFVGGGPFGRPPIFVYGRVFGCAGSLTIRPVGVPVLKLASGEIFAALAARVFRILRTKPLQAA